MPCTPSKLLCQTCFEQVWIQKCDPLYAASITANLPLHLSMEAAIFQGWKSNAHPMSNSTGFDTMRYHSRSSEVDCKVNSRKSLGVKKPITAFTDEDFQEISLANMVQELKLVKFPSTAECRNSGLAESTVRAVMERLLKNGEGKYAANQTQGKGFLEKFSRYFYRTQKVMPLTDISLREAYDYENICRVFYLKSILRELTRLGFRSSPETQMMLRTLVHKHSFFLLDAELLHEFVQFGTFDEPSESLKEQRPCGSFVHDWGRSAVQVFITLFQMKNSTDLRGPASFTFSLGNIVQYYVILQKYDAGHGLLCALFQRLNTEFVEKSVTFPERHTKRQDTSLDLIRKFGGLQIDGVPLTSKDLYTLLLSLQELSFEATDITALCVYLRLLADIHSILKLRCITESWKLPFVGDCTALVARIRNTARKEFSRANSYLVRKTRTQSVQKTVLDVLTKADKQRISLLISSQQRLHENYEKFIQVDLQVELLSLTCKLLNYREGSVDSGRQTNSTNHESHYFNPMALTKLFTFSVKQSRPSLAFYIVHRLLNTHSSVLRPRIYCTPWIKSSVSYLFIILRSYAVLRQQNKCIESDDYSTEFLDDLRLTWISILEEKRTSKSAPTSLDVQIMPYMAFILHKYHPPSTDIGSEFFKLGMGESIDFRCDNRRAPTAEAICLIIWTFAFLKSGKPQGVEPSDKRIIRRLTDFCNQIAATPVDLLSLLSKSLLREIAEEIDISWLRKSCSMKTFATYIKRNLSP